MTLILNKMAVILLSPQRINEMPTQAQQFGQVQMYYKYRVMC